MSRIEVNVLVQNEFVRGDEREVFFDGEPVREIPPTADLVTVLVEVGVFPSKSQARQNWQNLSAKFGLEGFAIPPGWTDLDGIGKMKHRITILNPTGANLP